MYNSKLHFHFTGIGGSGMSGIAEILLNLGFKVSGSDQKSSAVSKRLESLGAEIFYGHSGKNIPEGASLLVYSSAINFSNCEIIEAQRRGLPIIRRAEVLAELMRLKYGVGVAGSHGKTTTTSMTGAILEKGGLDPTVIIGGVVKSMGSGGRLGKGDYLVAETDESDRSFLLLKPTIAVVTNIDAEHLQAYSSLKELEESFGQFIAAVPFYGLAVLCIDDHKVRDLAAAYKRRKVTYGFSLDADLRAENIVLNRSKASYDVLRQGEFLCHIDLPLPGRHMALNSLAAIAVGLEFGLPVSVIQEALNGFGGVKRRIEVIGEVGGITLISDYAHHPSEIKATLRAVREGWQGSLRKLRVVFQPHRYSRTRDCFVEFIDAFSDCDELLLTEIYSAGEPTLEGITGQVLCDAISKPKPRFVGELSTVDLRALTDLDCGDVVVCMGAGSVGALAEDLLSQLSR